MQSPGTEPLRVGMIVTDLDGTLLHTDKSISSYSQNVLARCREHGIRVVFATARPPRAVMDYLDDVTTDSVICHNGAEVFVESKRMLDFAIEFQTAKQTLLAIKDALVDPHLSIEMDDTLYANYDATTDWPFTVFVMTDFSDLPNAPAAKIIARIKSPADISRIDSLLPDDLYVQMCEGKHGLVMSQAASKWNAIREVASYFGISISDVVAFGDDHNDIEMLANCGTGVAVANALDEAKAIADQVCVCNDDDGVAKWIDDHCLLTTDWLI